MNKNIIKNLIFNKDIKILENKDYKKGIGTSIALGMNNLIQILMEL